ncbi:MAG: NUMOD4 domain-containing protein [Mycobacterium sp.]|uniref:NUMOD4 domain-containing protein n=1 Tax=Mycobacterium sp. TaxID=1785 RepID=UPI003F9C1B59
MAEERWAPVAGHEDAYEISDRLRVRSVARRALCRAGHTRRVRERILVPVPRAGTRFAQVTLSSGGRRRRVYVHKLAAEAFSERLAV